MFLNPTSPPAKKAGGILTDLLTLLLLTVIGSLVGMIPMFGYTVCAVQKSIPGEYFEQMASGAISMEAYQEKIYEITLSVMQGAPCLLISLYGTAGTIGAVLIWCRCIKKQSRESLGMAANPLKAFRSVFFGLLLGAGLFSLAMAVCTLSHATVTSRSPQVNMGMWLLFLVGYMIQGFSEELLFRGFLQRRLETHVPFLPATLISSAMFAAAHAGNNGISLLAILNLFLFGIFAVLYAQRAKHIWGIAAFHGMWNFTEMCVWGTSVSGMPAVSSLLTTASLEGRNLTHGGAFGPEGGLGVTLALLCGIFVLLWLSLPSKKDLKKTPLT